VISEAAFTQQSFLAETEEYSRSCAAYRARLLTH
jgi:hypothetical protein